MSGHGKNILLSLDHLMQPRTNYFFSRPNDFLLKLRNINNIKILKYFQLPGSALRVCEQAWEPTERERCQPPRTPTLISTQWSATPPPPSSSRAPGPPPPAAPTVTSLQVRQTPALQSPLLTLIETLLPWEVAGWCYYLVMIPPVVANNDGRDTVVI